MRARMLIACVAAGLCGCSLLLAGELDEAREIVITPDGGDANASRADTGAPEASTDGQVSEAAAPKGCAAYRPAPKFCSDFDDDAGLRSWSLSQESGEISLESAEVVSGPSAAKVVVKDNADGCFYTRLEHDFDVTGTKRITVALRLRLQTPWPDAMIPLAIDLHPGGQDNRFCGALFFVAAPTGKPERVNIDVQSKAQSDHMFELEGYPSGDAWTEMKVTVTPLSGGGSSYETTFIDADGFTVVDRKDFPECPPWSRLGVHLGAHCDHRDATMFFDDVRVDWE